MISSKILTLLSFTVLTTALAALAIAPLLRQKPVVVAPVANLTAPKPLTKPRTMSSGPTQRPRLRAKPIVPFSLAESACV